MRSAYLQGELGVQVTHVQVDVAQRMVKITTRTSVNGIPAGTSEDTIPTGALGDGSLAHAVEALVRVLEDAALNAYGGAVLAKDMPEALVPVEVPPTMDMKL